MSEKELERVLPHELTANEIGHYHKAVATDEHLGGVEVASDLVYKGIMELWAYSDVKDEDFGDASILVILTRVCHQPDGYSELLVQCMSGVKVTSTGVKELAEVKLMEFAKKQGCARMIAYVKKDIWQVLADRLDDRYQEEYVLISLSPEDVLLGGE
jgi:hypothetical protein